MDGTRRVRVRRFQNPDPPIHPGPGPDVGSEILPDPDPSRISQTRGSIRPGDQKSPKNKEITTKTCSFTQRILKQNRSNQILEALFHHSLTLPGTEVAGSGVLCRRRDLGWRLPPSSRVWWGGAGGWLQRRGLAEGSSRQGRAGGGGWPRGAAGEGLEETGERERGTGEGDWERERG